MSSSIQSISDEAKQFANNLLEKASHEHLSDLFASPPPQTLYYLPNRNGISVIAVPTRGMTTEQLIRLQRYRLAQYVTIGFVDAQATYERGMDYEPLDFIGPEDIHFIATSSATGEILCYCSFWSLPDPQSVAADTTLLAHERPLFPVEENFGWGIYNKLEILPFLPISGIFEMKRFVKNQSLNALDELGIRAPVEVGIAIVETLTGPLRLQAVAMVGSIEEGVAKHNLEYFHIPLVLIHGSMPIAEDTDYLLPHFRDVESFPFAVLISDLSGPVLTRLQQIVLALQQPGKHGLLELLRLKKELSTQQSSLIPPRGLDALNNIAVQQKEIPMPVRRQMFNLGNQLREIDLFQGLSVADATTLRTFMETMEVAPGEVIVKQGDVGDALYLIEEGQVDVLVSRPGGDFINVRQLGPGEYFGEIGLLSGGLRIATVVTASPTKLLRLTRETFMHYLAERSEVEQRMAAVAARRIVDTGRKVSGSTPG
jgi:hypothetical protein